MSNKYLNDSGLIHYDEKIKEYIQNKGSGIAQLTQAEYDALTEEEKRGKIFLITDAEAQGIVIDDALSTTSVNPVQNKVITAALNRTNPSSAANVSYDSTGCTVATGANVQSAIKQLDTFDKNLSKGVDVSEEDGDISVTITSKNLDIEVNSDESLSLSAENEVNIQSIDEMNIASTNSNVIIKANSDITFESNSVTTNLGDIDISEIDDGTITGTILYLDTNKMDKTNSTGTGSFSLNRKADTTVGDYSFAEGYETTAEGECSHTEGYDTLASGSNSHAEGSSATASGDCSHAEGADTTASGTSSHAEGNETTAVGEDSHAEGTLTTANGVASHAEGNGATASSIASHAEGSKTVASGFSSHAEGTNTKASGYSSHAEGNETKASGNYQHVQGTYNVEDTANKYAHIVGGGTSDTTRKNIHTLDWSGNAEFAGDVTSTNGSGNKVSLNEINSNLSAKVSKNFLNWGNNTLDNGTYLAFMTMWSGTNYSLEPIFMYIVCSNNNITINYIITNSRYNITTNGNILNVSADYQVGGGFLVKMCDI